MGRTVFSLAIFVTVLLMATASFAEMRTMTQNMVCCGTEDSTIQVNKWLTEGDRAAVVKEVLSGECQMISAGTVVFVEKHGFEWAKIRQKGSTVTVWTLEKYLR